MKSHTDEWPRVIKHVSVLGILCISLLSIGVYIIAPTINYMLHTMFQLIDQPIRDTHQLIIAGVFCVSTYTFILLRYLELLPTWRQATKQSR